MQLKNTVIYSEISNSDAKLFLSQEHANCEHISISNAMFWIGASNNNNLIGIVGISATKNTIRIKGFFVKKSYRGIGVGSALLDYLINKDPITSIAFKNTSKVSAFATENSEPLFFKLGLSTKHINKNNIKFMEMIK